MHVPDALRIPVPVDTGALVRDVEALPPESWVPHFNTGVYSGEWSGVPLLMVGGRADRLFPDPNAAPGTPATPTPRLAECPSVIGLLDSLPCPVTSARLLRLGPGASVREHRDFGLGHADGEARLHVPVHTDQDAEFRINGRRLEMAPGECWYVDVSQPHAVANSGSAPRVHLVVDCVVDKGLNDLLLRALAQE